MKTFKAPFRSRVTTLAVQNGEAVSAGQVIAALMPLQMEAIMPNMVVPAIRSPIAGYVVIYPNVKLGAVVDADDTVFSIATEAEKEEAVRNGGMEIQSTGLRVHMGNSPVEDSLLPENSMRMSAAPPAASPPVEDAAALRYALGPKERRYGRGAGSFAMEFMPQQQPRHQIEYGWREVTDPLKNFPVNLNQMTDDHLVILVLMANAYFALGKVDAASTLYSLIMHESLAHGHELGRVASNASGNAIITWSQQRVAGLIPRNISPTNVAEFVDALRSNFGLATCEELFGKPAARPPPPPVLATPVTAATVPAPPPAIPEMSIAPLEQPTEPQVFPSWWISGGVGVALVLLLWWASKSQTPLPEAPQQRSSSPVEAPRAQPPPEAPNASTPSTRAAEPSWSNSTKTATKHKRHKTKHKKKRKHKKHKRHHRRS